MSPATPVAGGIRLAVRLTPKGGRDALGGVATHDGQPVLLARVSAPPVDGAANAALVRLVAKALGTAPRDVRLVAGATARIKRLEIDGDPAELMARVAGLG